MQQTNSLITGERDLLRAAMAIAGRAVVSDIESYCVRVDGPPGRWYDTRPMLDPREHASEVIDMAAQAMAYAEAAGLVTRHADHKHLVCITPAGQAV